ncbi:uncharacterized protein LOC124367196 [Homalodisca vitripennis]|uniref:uncharacterized protein LOC124367196 n=1 Tax=Homalodisca vitripennis TaxID=197043 RepID=UPI001EEA99AA|nr:uncharacterized protein LOC124367196 [Homalodisca vitripennis]
MELNIAKCLVISYTRSNTARPLDYSLNGSPLKVVDRVRDLGVIMTPSLSPYEHIMHVTNKASSMLGFIARTCKDFRSPSTLAILYKTLVRRLLEYCSVVWSPYQVGHIVLLNRVQVRCLRLLGVKLGYNYLATPVAEIEMLYGM